MDAVLVNKTEHTVGAIANGFGDIEDITSLPQQVGCTCLYEHLILFFSTSNVALFA